jgi:hypothetical protein
LNFVLTVKHVHEIFHVTFYRFDNRKGLVCMYKQSGVTLVIRINSYRTLTVVVMYGVMSNLPTNYILYLSILIYIYMYITKRFFVPLLYKSNIHQIFTYDILKCLK